LNFSKIFDIAQSLVVLSRFVVVTCVFLIVKFLLRNNDCKTIEQIPANIPVHVVGIGFNFWIPVGVCWRIDC